MTQLELFRATVYHQPHIEFLFRASFTPHIQKRLVERYRLALDTESVQKRLRRLGLSEYPLPEEMELDEYFGMFKPVRVNPKETIPQADYSSYYVGVKKPKGSFINSLGVLNIPAQFYHFTRYISPLRNAATLREIEAFPFPLATSCDETGMKKQVEKAHKKGLVSETVIGHMYENAWQVRGYEEFLIDMHDDPKRCEYILDRFAERNERIAATAGRAGVDMLLTGDDVANQNALMFSKEMWQKFMKSRWAKVFAAARAGNPNIQIWYHSDGDITSIIPDLIEIGVTILNPLQPECLNLKKLKKEFGAHLVFEGSIGTQSTMPFATPDEIKRVIRERKKTLGYDGALIIAPTHILEPEVPLENIEAFVEACREK